MKIRLTLWVVFVHRRTTNPPTQTRIFVTWKGPCVTIVFPLPIIVNRVNRRSHSHALLVVPRTAPPPNDGRAVAFTGCFNILHHDFDIAHGHSIKQIHSHLRTVGIRFMKADTLGTCLRQSRCCFVVVSTIVATKGIQLVWDDREKIDY